MNPGPEAPCAQSTAQVLVSMEDVSLRLNGTLLFEHTNWEIRADQHWALIGPNGAGKSVLMRAIAGQVPVVKGRIVYHWEENGSLPHRQVAHVSFDAPAVTLRREGRFYQARWNAGTQEGSLAVSDYLSEKHVLPINPYEVVERPSDTCSFDGYRERVVAMLAIGDLLPKQLIQLSDGERRKVSIARALLRKPRLLILDNPFTGLDGQFRAKLQQVVRRLMDDGLQIIVVTARPQDIPPQVTHVLVVEDGHVVDQGTREEVLERQLLSPQQDNRAPLELQFPSATRANVDQAVLVRMRDVSITYGATPILSGIDWAVRTGEHWALIGPNGSGKTTLLSLILGDHPQAYANDISLFGQRRGSGESIWQIKKHIGWVSPELHLYYPKQISCLDVVCSGLHDSVGLFGRCTPQQRQAALSWMERLHIVHCVGKPFSTASEGEQRIVLLARALVKEPALLVLDEPCQGLDARHRGQIRHLVDAVGHHLDTTIIYVTHDIDELPSIITQVLRLDSGRIAFSGALSADPTQAQS